MSPSEKAETLSIVLSICMKECPFTLLTHPLTTFFLYVDISLYTHEFTSIDNSHPINTYLSIPWPSKNKHEGDLMEY